MKFKGVHVCRRWVSLEDNGGIFREGFWSLPNSTSLATAASLSVEQSTSLKSFLESNCLLERNCEHWSRKLREFWMVDPWHLTAIAPSTQNLQLPTTCYFSVRIWVCHQEPSRRMIYTASLEAGLMPRDRILEEMDVRILTKLARAAEMDQATSWFHCGQSSSHRWWKSSSWPLASRSRSRSSPRKGCICLISQGCHKVICIDKANFKIVFPRTRGLTSNEELYLISVAIALLVDNYKGLLKLCTRLCASTVDH